MYIRVISLFLALGVFIVPKTNYAQDKELENTCSQLVDWLYKDLTLQNLDKSFERMKSKLFMGMLKTVENANQVNLKNHPKLLKLWKSLANIDPEFEDYLKTNSPYNRYHFWRGKSYRNLKTYDFFSAIKAWKDLQTSTPEYFKGLEDKYKLDKWDLLTADTIDNINQINYKNKKVRNKLESLSKKIKEMASTPATKLTKNVNLTVLKKEIDDIQKNIYDNSSDIYKKYLNDYAHVCNLEDMAKNDPLHMEEYLCLARNDEMKPDIAPLLVGLANIVTIKNLNTTERPAIPVPPPHDTRDEVEKLKIVKIDYDVNPDPKATYCERDPNMINTLVIHHTGEGKEVGPELINEGHIGRSTDGKPWYMVAYNYLVSERDYGGTSENPSIIQGRPPEMKGAHAGGYTRKLSKKRKEELKRYSIKCGRDDHFVETNMSKEFLNGRISGNITSLGIAVLGNYEQKYRATIGGVTIIRNASGKNKVTYPNSAVIAKVAELACKLQRQYPNIKRIVPHSYFKATNCPGSIIAKLQKITNLANSYDGCHFNDPEYVK